MPVKLPHALSVLLVCHQRIHSFLLQQPFLDQQLRCFHNPCLAVSLHDPCPSVNLQVVSLQTTKRMELTHLIVDRIAKGLLWSRNVEQHLFHLGPGLHLNHRILADTEHRVQRLNKIYLNPTQTQDLIRLLACQTDIPGPLDFQLESIFDVPGRLQHHSNAWMGGRRNEIFPVIGKRPAVINQE